MPDSELVNRGKNIVIFSDGTGQEGGVGNNTNVYKLFQMVEDRTDRQVAFYDAGLGTGWRKVTGNLLGAGISKNILECYQFISDNYKWGDRIFMFGFSRGATTVRSLAGFISRFGVLPHSRPELAKKAWDIYKIADEDARRRKTKEFLKRNTTTWCNVDFLGVWDTVAALGLPLKPIEAALPRKYTFHDIRLSRCVKHGYHAMSIDEDRKAFKVRPWRTEKDGKSLLGEVYQDPRDGDDNTRGRKENMQTVKQVWFAGVHTDTGGGYAECGVSDISLAWMIDRATDEAVLEHPLILFPYSPVVVDQNIEGPIHSERDTLYKRFLFRKRLRSWDSRSGGKPIIHASVLERKRGKHGEEDKPYKPWILEAFKEGEYEVETWNQSGMYSIPIEIEYRSDPDPEGSN